MEEYFNCYKTWHTAKLDALRKTKNCDAAPPLHIIRVNHGFGDAGRGFLVSFREAVKEGRMLMADFPGSKENNVWVQAIDSPFDMDLRANQDILCVPHDIIASQEWHFKTIGEPSTLEDQRKSHPSFDMNPKKLWFLLFPPKQEVIQLVDEVMSKVLPGDKLVGVHFRSQWAHMHHSCGCLDLSEIGQCAGNMGSFLSTKGQHVLNASKTHIFVAADQDNGIKAFERAFDSSNILSTPSGPIQHSLSCTNEGAIRIYADLMLLAKADALIGSCGSTFSQMANRISGRDKKALPTYIVTGTPEAKECASMQGETRDLSGFSKQNFVGQSNMDKCDCYAPGDALGGTCKFQCFRKSNVPSKCAAWQQKPEFSKVDESAQSVPWHQMTSFV